MLLVPRISGFVCLLHCSRKLSVCWFVWKKKYILDELEDFRLQVTTLVTLQARAQDRLPSSKCPIYQGVRSGKCAWVHVHATSTHEGEAAFMGTLMREYIVKLVANESQCVTEELVWRGVKSLAFGRLGEELEIDGTELGLTRTGEIMF